MLGGKEYGCNMCGGDQGLHNHGEPSSEEQRVFHESKESDVSAALLTGRVTLCYFRAYADLQGRIGRNPGCYS